jgi:hypothetical protein
VNTLSRQRCFNHTLREAVARCTECTQFFCRECITEHDDRVVCAACLKKLTVAQTRVRFRTGWIFPTLACATGLALLWFTFYFFGATLLSIPSSFHEGNVWAEKFFHK